MHTTPSTSSASKTFLSIKDAAERYQKAEITIRRFVRSVLEREKARERAFIHPLPRDAMKLKKQRKTFSYTIAEGLLERNFGPLPTTAVRPKKEQQDDYKSLLERTNATLQAQLNVKDNQIKSLALAIDDLSERQRETNILMKNLQERLLLAAPKQGVVDADVVSPKRVKRKWWGIFGEH